MFNTKKLTSKVNIIKGVFLVMCVTVVAANLNISQAVKAAETVQDNKIKSGDYEPVKYSGSCTENGAWVENTPDNTVTSIAYFVKNDNRRFDSTDTPAKSPEKYYRIMCASGDRVNYVAPNGLLTKIKNGFVQSIVSREIDDIVEEVVNGKLETKKTKKIINDTYYINTGNDYLAKFPTDPNQGFFYKTNKENDAAIFEVVKVSIGGKSLQKNTPVIKDNILTYPEVLPGVDLKYLLQTNGIAKFFEIKNAEAIKNNDLTSFTLDLADNTKINKKDEKNDKLKAILESKGVTNDSAPTLTKAKEGIELVVETKQVTETKTVPVIAPVITPSSTPAPAVVPQSSVPSSSSVSAPTTSSIPTLVDPKASTSVPTSSSSIASNIQASSIPAPIIPTPTLTPAPATKTETTTTTQTKSDVEIQIQKEVVKTNIINELDVKIAKLEEIKKEEESKGNNKDAILLDLATKSIESTKSLTAEVKSNTINVADEKAVAESIKAVENVSTGNEVLTLANNEGKVRIGLPEVFDQNVDNTKTISSSISKSNDRITISVDKDYLNSKDRKFPIYVDPSVNGLQPNEGDTTVTSNEPNRNWGGFHHLSIGGNTYINVAGRGYAQNVSRSYLKFNAPVPADAIVVDVKLKMYQYSGNAFNTHVHNSYDFNEYDANWNSPTDGKPSFAEKIADMYTRNGEGWNESSDFADLLNRNLRGNTGIMRLVVKDDREDLGASQYRSAIHCSRNDSPWGEANMCTNGQNKPHLNILYTRKPGAPAAKNFSNANFIGGCDSSKTVLERGNCDVNSYKTLLVSNVNSGDGNSENSNTLMRVTNTTGTTFSNDDPSVNFSQNKRIKTPFNNNDGRDDSASDSFGSGVFKNQFWNQDQYAKDSESKNEYFQVDNGSPVAYSGIKTDGTKSYDGSYIIGRSNPENTQPQIKFSTPAYMDSTYNKFSVIPKWDPSKMLDISGGFNPVDFSGANQGRAITINQNQKYNLDAQVFSQDGDVIRANNSEFCWDTQRGANDKLVIAKCTGFDNQRFAYDSSTNQFKLLDNKNQFGKITSFTNKNVGLNIWGGKNDNSTEIRMNPITDDWNMNFYYDQATKQIINQYGKCLDAGNNTKEQNLTIFDCHGNTNQRFDLDAQNRIYNKTSNLCVDSYSGDNIGSRLYMGDCHNGVNQKFKFEIISQEITIQNAKNCVEGSKSSGELFIRKCSDSEFQKFNYSTESIVRITAPGGANDKGSTFNSVQSNGLGSWSKAFTQPTAMPWQYFRLLHDKKQIRTYENMCLMINSRNNKEILFYECSDTVDYQWEEVIINGKKSIQSVYKPNGTSLCITSGNQGENIYASQCTGADNQTFGFENYQKWLFPTNEMKYQARISETQDGKTGTSIVIPWQSSPVFQFNADQNLSQAYENITEIDPVTKLPIFASKYKLKIEDGKSYFVSIQAKDQNSEISNISAWSQPTKILVDTSLPIVKELKTSIKGNDKSISFNVQENNFATAELNIIDTNNKIVRTIKNCNDKPCIAINTTAPTNLSFKLDGLDDNGQDLTDANYRIEPVVTDFAGNRNADSTQPGGINSMDTDVNGATGKSSNLLLITNSASVYITNPANNSWVNTDTYKIEGSSGRVNSKDQNGVAITKTIKQIDFTKLDLDGTGILSFGTPTEKLEYNNLNNFSKEVKLDYGKNEFKIVAIDSNNKTNSKIGDPTKERVESWIINKEDNAPLIESIKFNNIQSTKQNIVSINEAKTSISFTALDSFVPGMQLVSGLYKGKNPKGYDISLLRSVDDGKSYREIPLFKDGVNISDPNPNPRLAGDLDCLDVTGKTTCTFMADNLKLDALYKLHLKVYDIAGNIVCTRHDPVLEQSLNKDTKCPPIKTIASTIPYYTPNPIREYTAPDFFRIKTFTYLNSINDREYEILPAFDTNIPGVTTTKSTIGTNTDDYSFEVEENALLHYKNLATNRSIFINPSLPTLPLETDITDKIPSRSKVTNYYNTPDSVLVLVNSVCGSTVDHDSIAETPLIKTCKVSFKVKVKTQTNKSIPIENQIVIQAINGLTSQIYKTNTIVDVSKYIIATTSTISTLSPDGDGNFDTIKFGYNFSYQGNYMLFKTADDYKLAIKDQAGKVVFEPDTKLLTSTDPKALSYTFDGKVTTLVNGKPVTKLLPGGQYTFSISMLSRSGDKTRVTSNELPFSIVSSLSKTMPPLIATPTPNFTTTRGVVTLQGNGVKSDPKNKSDTWSADVCARLSNKSLVNAAIQATIPANGCVYQSSVKTSSTGFFTLLVTLPYANQSYDLEVKSTNPNGNQSSPPVVTKVEYKTPESIMDFQVSSSIEGLNTADQMKCAFGNERTTTTTIKCDTVNVNNLKTLKITTTVIKGVEGVELDFNDLTNLNALPTSDTNEYNKQYSVNNGKRIAIINDLTETNRKFNPTADSRVKANQVGVPIPGVFPFAVVGTGKDLSYAQLSKPCLLETCTWTYYYILPYQMAGGKYEVRARTYLGESVQQATSSFEVNGVLKLAPKLIRAQREVTSAACQYLLTFEPTSTQADPCKITNNPGTTESLTLKSTNQDIGNNVLGTTQTRLQTLYSNKSTVKAYVGGDLNTEFAYKLTAGNTTLKDTKAITSSKGLAELTLELNAMNSGLNTLTITPLNPTTKLPVPAEATAYNFVYDMYAPTLNQVFTTNKSTSPSTPSINPWIRNGDQINFDIKTTGNEAIDYGYVISESGYREPLKAMINGAPIQVGGNTSGNGIGLGSNAITSYQADLTIQREKLEGVYFPTIYLQDLAGNSSLFNNDTSTVLLKNIINDNKPNLKKVVNGTTQYDFDQVAYTNIMNMYSATPTLPINNSGNLDGGRKGSLDFSLLLDNTKPLRGDFNMLGVGDSVIEYDSVTNSPKLSSPLQSTNSTRPGAIRTDGIEASSISINTLTGLPTEKNSFMPVGPNGKGMIEVDRLVGQKTTNPNNTGQNKDATNQGYSLVTRDNLVELRISAEKNTRLTLLLKEGKETTGNNLGAENSYSQEQIISPSSTTIDQSSCTTNPSSVSKLGVSKATGSTNQLIRLAGSKNGLYKPELQAAGMSGGTDKNMVVNAYDNNLIPMLASDVRASSDKLGYSQSGRAEDRVVTQSATYCDIVFKYDFKNRTDFTGKKISDSGKKSGFGESPSGKALEYFSLSFYSTDLSGNVSMSDLEYSKLLNNKEFRVFNNSNGGGNGGSGSNSGSSSAANLFNELVNGNQPIDSLGNSNCAYNPITGQLDPTIYSADLAAKFSDVIIPRVNNSSFGCSVSIKYDAEAPGVYNSISSSPVVTSNLGVRTGITNITSSSYKNGETQLSIPDLNKSNDLSGGGNVSNTSGNIIGITRDTSIQVTSTAEARADMVYTMNGGNSDSSVVAIQDPLLVPGVGGGNSLASGNYKEFGTTLDIKSSKNQQSKSVVLKQDASKVLLDKFAPYEWYYFNGTTNNSTQKVEQSRLSNTVRVLQNGELDNPTRTTSFTLARNTTVKNPGLDNKNKRDEDVTKKVAVQTSLGEGAVTATGGGNAGNLNDIKAGSDCTRIVNGAINTSLGAIPATVNRRVGVCDDGLYKVNTYAVDSAGNYAVDGGGNVVWTSRVLERDTVSPGAPTIEYNLAGDILSQTLNLKVTGEGNTNANVTIENYGNNIAANTLNFSFKLGANGQWSSNDLLGKLKCESTYILKVNLTDRANNKSEDRIIEFQTMECPKCPEYENVLLSDLDKKTFTSKFIEPIRGNNGYHSDLQLYGQPRSSNGKSWGHEGLDFNGAGNPSVYSIGTGTVTSATMTGTYGGTIKIDHQNGYSSEYGHLKNIDVRVGQKLDSNIKLGNAGSTYTPPGYSQGDHLHLNVYQNGTKINPLPLLGKDYTYKPVVISKNTKYAVIVKNPANVDESQARILNCEMPALKSDIEYSSDDQGGNVTNSENELVKVKTAILNTHYNSLNKIEQCVNNAFNKYGTNEEVLRMINGGKIGSDTNAVDIAERIKEGCFVNQLDGSFYSLTNESKENSIKATITNRTANLQSTLDSFSFTTRNITGNINNTIDRWGQNYNDCKDNWRKCLSQDIIPWIQQNWQTIVEFVVTTIAGLGCISASRGLGGFVIDKCIASAAVFSSTLKQLLKVIDVSIREKRFAIEQISIQEAVFDFFKNYVFGLAFKFVFQIMIPVVVNGAKWLMGKFNGTEVYRRVADAGDELCASGKNCNFIKEACNCFVAGTLVTGLVFANTDLPVNARDIDSVGGYQLRIAGLIESNQLKTAKLPIETYKEGDYLLTKNVFDTLTPAQGANDPNYLKNEFQPIKRTIQQMKNRMARVIVTNSNTNQSETLTTTQDHEWIVFDESNSNEVFKSKDSVKQIDLSNHKEKITSELKSGDKIIDKDNQKYIISGVKIFNEPTKTYNFTMVNNHNYFVGDREILVHNSCSTILIGHNLQSITNSNNTAAHLFEGNINRRGSAGGYHHAPSAGANTYVKNITDTAKNGIYEAEVIIQGIPKYGNDGKSTMFSDKMTQTEIGDLIFNAYNNGLIRMEIFNNPRGSIVYLGKSNGIDIEFLLDNNLKIISAYPAKKHTLFNGLEIYYNGFKK